ncbi:hypothetical protein C0416_02465 [bacterium]|nr:hypothetical protein [bacterium]
MRVLRTRAYVFTCACGHYSTCVGEACEVRAGAGARYVGVCEVRIKMYIKKTAFLIGGLGRCGQGCAGLRRVADEGGNFFGIAKYDIISQNIFRKNKWQKKGD